MNNALRKILVVSTVASLLPLNAPGQNGVWSNTAGGSWFVATNWSNNVIANAFGATADFSQLALPGPLDVTLDGSVTVGAMIFGDVSNAYGCQIDGGTGGTLTLAASNSPIIAVNNQTLTITAALDGTNGLTKDGDGELTLSNDTATTYTGPTTINAGVLSLHDTTDATTYHWIAAGATLEINVSSGLRNYPTTTYAGLGTLRKVGAGDLVWGYTSGTFALGSGSLIDVEGGSFEAGSSENEVWTNNLSDLNVAAGATFYTVGAYVRVNRLTGTGVIVGGWYEYPTLTIGLANGSSTFGGVIEDVGAYGFTGNLVKEGTGAIALTGNNTYTGPTTVSNGTLLVDSPGSLGGSPVFVSAGTLAGNGAIYGPVTVQSGGTLGAGDPESMGTLTLGNSLTFEPGATNCMRIAKTGGMPTNDMITGLTSANFDGTLFVTNATADSNQLAAGDTFTLFPSGPGASSGFYANYNLPALGMGLSWDVTQLTRNGSISVVHSAPPPRFSVLAGGYIGAQTVALWCLDTNAIIYYTTNGTEPTTDSAVYGAPFNIPVNSTLTIEAFCYDPSYDNSAVISQSYATAATAVWTNTAGGSWLLSSNWAYGIIPNQVDAPADFSQLDLSSNVIVTLDGQVTAGTLWFDDRSGDNHSWTLANGTLALMVSTGAPVISNNAPLIVTAAVSGAQGLTKTGPGALTFADGILAYSGLTTVNGGSFVLQDTDKYYDDIIVNQDGTVVFNSSAAGFDNRGPLQASAVEGSGAFTVSNAVSGIAGGWVTFENSGGLWNFTGAVNIVSGVLSMDDLNGEWSGAPRLNVLAGGLLALRGQNISIDALTGNGDVFDSWDGNGAAGDTLTVGANNGSGTFSGVIHGSIIGGTDGDLEQGIVNLTKAGTGSQVLTGANTYAGVTTVSGGTLLVNSPGSLETNVVIVLGGTLGGDGVINGPVTVQSGGTLIAESTASCGALTISNAVTLAPGSATMLKIDAAHGTNDSLRGLTSLTCGGSLYLTNIGGALAAGNTFQLFNAQNYAGNFAATNLPPLAAGLAWQWTPMNGTLSVVSTAPPTLTNIVMSGVGSVSLTFSGPANQSYQVLMTTNLALPINEWTPLATGVFGPAPVQFTDAHATNATRFYCIGLQ